MSFLHCSRQRYSAFTVTDSCISSSSLFPLLLQVLVEYLFDLVAKHPNTIRDGSAVVTGLLLALSLSPTVPLYLPCIGSIFAILFVKCFFGGLGRNFMNPALTGRCFLLISFGSAMTDFHIDGVSSATPIAALKAGEAVDIARNSSGFAPCCHRRLRTGAAHRRYLSVHHRWYHL